MNVGRNYNGPKVLKLSKEGFRRTRTVANLLALINELEITQNSSYLMHSNMQLVRNMVNKRPTPWILLLKKRIKIESNV